METVFHEHKYPCICRPHPGWGRVVSPIHHVAGPVSVHRLRPVFQVVFAGRLPARRAEQDDDDDCDETSKVMQIADPLDCIGCEACGKVCPKSCLAHASL